MEHNQKNCFRVSGAAGVITIPGLGKIVLAVGGKNNVFVPTNDVKMYFINEDKWELRSNMALPSSV